MCTSAWWAHVTVTPLARRIQVLSNGTEKGDKATTPLGGHTIPNSTVGIRAASKKAQKKEKKKNTSDKIKRSIPRRSLNSSLWVW